MYQMCLLLLVMYAFLNITTLTAHIINPKNEKVIICGTGKNIARGLPNMVQKIEELGKHFKDYYVIIYENNSTDTTQQLLRDWSSKNHKVTILSEILSPQQLHNRTIAHALKDGAPCRMELIAYGRNQLLRCALSKYFTDFNFIIMTDLDFTRGWEVDGVLSSFNLPMEWDCVTANGVWYANTYYDRYAYRDNESPFGPELLGENYWNYIEKHPLRFEPKSLAKKVYSAFGGIAIYKKDALKNCSYSGTVTKDLETWLQNIIDHEMTTETKQSELYRQIIEKITRQQKSANFQPTETRSINTLVAQTAIKRSTRKYHTHKIAITRENNHSLSTAFQATCGYDKPVICEHIPLHASMILNGHDKIYVNPAMLCLY